MNKTTHPLIASLMEKCPSLAISTHRTPDYSYAWDGDGQDPVERGMECLRVTVTARMIWHGVCHEASDYLCGVYEYPTEPDQEIGGYFPQMVLGAIEELQRSLACLGYTDSVLNEAKGVCEAFMIARYNSQHPAP